MTGQKPVEKWTAGQISAALWQNEIEVNGKMVSALKATVQRRYKDKSGTWKSSGSFGRNEIPLAIYCLDDPNRAVRVCKFQIIIRLITVADIRIATAIQQQ